MKIYFGEFFVITSKGIRKKFRKKILQKRKFFPSYRKKSLLKRINKELKKNMTDLFQVFSGLAHVLLEGTYLVTYTFSCRLIFSIEYQIQCIIII